MKPKLYIYIKKKLTGGEGDDRNSTSSSSSVAISLVYEEEFRLKEREGNHVVLSTNFSARNVSAGEREKSSGFLFL